MLKEGVPVLHILRQVESHNRALEELPDETEGKFQALADCKEYEKRIRQERKFSAQLK